MTPRVPDATARLAHQPWAWLDGDTGGVLTWEQRCSPCQSAHACDIGWVEESLAGSIPFAGNADRQRVPSVL